MLSIVIIEDYADYASMLTSFLRYGLHREHECHTCPTIAAALAHLRDHPAGLVILDLGLPDAQGLSGVRQVHSAYPEAPLLVITGIATEDLGDLPGRVEAIGHSVHFLTKDEIRIQDFSYRVRAILNTFQAPAPPPVAIPTGPVLLPHPLAPPWYYPYVRDALVALLLVTALVLGAGQVDAIRQEQALIRRDIAAHAKESQEARGRMERVMSVVLDTLTKRSSY